MTNWQDARITSGTSFAITGLPDMIPDGTVACDRIVLALIATNPPTSTPPGWETPPGGYSDFGPVTDPTSGYDLIFYTKPVDGDFTVTFTFAASTRAVILAFGGIGDILDPATQGIGGKFGGTAPGMGAWSFDESFTSRSDVSVFLGWTGSVSENVGSDYVVDANSLTVGGGVDLKLVGLTDLNNDGTMVTADFDGNGAFGAERYDFYLFEFGTVAPPPPPPVPPSYVDPGPSSVRYYRYG